MKLSGMIESAARELRTGKFWSGCLRASPASGRQKGVTRIAAALGVTKGHVSRCLRGERHSGRVLREAERGAA